MKKKYLFYAALLIVAYVLLRFLRFLFTWVMAGALVLGALWWLTRKKR